jgi:hypothetical protein
VEAEQHAEELSQRASNLEQLANTAARQGEAVEQLLAKAEAAMLEMGTQVAFCHDPFALCRLSNPHDRHIPFISQMSKLHCSYVDANLVHLFLLPIITSQVHHPHGPCALPVNKKRPNFVVHMFKPTWLCLCKIYVRYGLSF